MTVLTVRTLSRRSSLPQRRPRPLSWWREALIVAAVWLAYELSRGVVDHDAGPAVATGRGILSWETRWHLAPERWLNHLLQHSRFLEVVSAYFYSTMHYAVTPAVLIWMFRRHAAHFRLARTTLAISTVIGLVVYHLLPTAPPRLLPGSGIADTLAQVSSFGWWSDHGSVPRGFVGLSNQFAAMPSLHVGWALWAGLALWRFGRYRLTRWAAAAYPVITTLVVIATGNHYMLDVIAGAATMAAASGLAYLAHRRQVIVEAEAIVEEACHPLTPSAAVCGGSAAPAGAGSTAA